MDALRRSTLELWQYFEEHSFNTLLYRGPAITHPSVGFYLSPNIQFVVGDLSISGTLLTIFWARTPCLWQNNGTRNTPTHIPSPWSGSSGSCHRPAHSVAACLLPLPPFGCRCFLQRTFPLEASSRLIQLCRRLLSTTSTSTAVWVPLWFRYGVFSISYYFPHLFRFVGMPLRFLPFLFTRGLPSSK